MKAVAAAKEHWSTFWQLVAAAGSAVGRRPSLAFFPLLALGLMVVASFFLSLMYLVSAAVLVLLKQKAHHIELLVPVLCWYATNVILTFCSVALSHAALSALRQQRVSVVEALGAAARRWPAILGFAVLSSTFGAALSAVERRSQWVVRATMTVFGLSWTLVSLFALTAMAGERVGTLGSLRRGTVLLRGCWAEQRLTTLGMGLLWVPLLALEAGSVWLIRLLHPAWAGSALWLVVAVNAIVWATFWLLERVYVAAVYCYAVEGVVPSTFEAPALEPLLQVRPALAMAGAPRAWGSNPALAGWLRRQRLQVEQRRTLWAMLAAATFAVGFVVTRPAWHRAIQTLFPDPPLTINDATFPHTPALHKRLGLMGDALGITSTPTASGPVVSVFFEKRILELDRKFAPRTSRPLPLPLEDIANVDWFERTPGMKSFIGTANGPHRNHLVLAMDARGELLFQRAAANPESEFPHAVDAVAPLRTPEGWGVAVGYNGSYGLCFIDAQGVEKWCNRDVGNVWFVTSMDCDGDGWEEIVSLLPGWQHGYGCYDVRGRLIAERPLPVDPVALRAVDLDGDGEKELTYLVWERRDRARFGALRADGTPLVDVEVAQGEGKPLPRLAPLAVRRSSTGPMDIVTLGPEGELLGVSLDGERWRAGRDYLAFTVIDLDGDGLDELIGLGGPLANTGVWDGHAWQQNRNLDAWTWGPD